MKTEKSISSCVLLLSKEVNEKDQNNQFRLLPPLYPEDAYEPYMSKQTVQFHYGKHLLGYIENTNKLIANTEFADRTIEEIMLNSSGKLFNNSAQVFNHYFQFEALRPAKEGKTELPQKLNEKIEESFGSLEDFKKKFSEAAVSLFGSGYAWLIAGENGKLEIVQTKNAENPLTQGKKPILNLDVWEHAYYLDVQNLRAKYVESFWNIVDWEKVEKRMLCKE